MKNRIATPISGASVTRMTVGRLTIARIAIAWTAIVTCLVMTSGCQSTRKSGPVDHSGASGAIAQATRAVVAYEQGNCEGVEEAARLDDVETWEMSEVRHSTLLVHAFCQEMAGRIEDATETYRALVREAPLSFASDDARERLRIIRLIKNDPDYAIWVGEARSRALTGSSDRVPVDRVPADFPPLAQEAGVEGFAVVEFGVTPRGDTDAPIVVESVPPLIFDGAALRAVREWRYARDPSSKASKRQAIRLVFKSSNSSQDGDSAGMPASIQ